MKFFLPTSLLVLLVLTGTSRSWAQAQAETQNDKATALIVRSVKMRVAQGDGAALSELAAVSDEVALPFLVDEYLYGPDKNVRNSAMDFLRQRKAEVYFGEKAAKTNLDNSSAVTTIELALQALSALHTKAAVRYLAAILSDETPASRNGDDMTSPKRYLAAAALRQMKLRDAPPIDANTRGEESVDVWRGWWKTQNEFYQGNDSLP